MDMPHSTAPTRSSRRPSRAERHWLWALAAGGVLAGIAVGFFALGIAQYADDRELLISRMVAACQEDDRQTYLMHAACREANEQAIETGMQLVVLPALDPAPMTLPPAPRGH